jgi:transposase-like protein
VVQIDKEKRVDWHQIRAEYISGGISYRQIAKKYDIPFGTVRGRAQKEKWVKERECAEHNVNTITAQKIAEKTADNAVIFERMRKKALLKLERELDSVLEKEGTESRHTETYFSEEGKRTISETTISKLADILALMERIAGAGFGTNEPQLKAIREILDGVPSAIN